MIQAIDIILTFVPPYKTVDCEYKQDETFRVRLQVTGRTHS